MTVIDLVPFNEAPEGKPCGSEGLCVALWGCLESPRGNTKGLVPEAGMVMVGEGREARIRHRFLGVYYNHRKKGKIPIWLNVCPFCRQRIDNYRMRREMAGSEA